MAPLSPLSSPIGGRIRKKGNPRRPRRNTTLPITRPSRVAAPPPEFDIDKYAVAQIPYGLYTVGWDGDDLEEGDEQLSAPCQHHITNMGEFRSAVQTHYGSNFDRVTSFITAFADRSDAINWAQRVMAEQKKEEADKEAAKKFMEEQDLRDRWEMARAKKKKADARKKRSEANKRKTTAKKASAKTAQARDGPSNPSTIKEGGEESDRSIETGDTDKEWEEAKKAIESMVEQERLERILGREKSEVYGSRMMMDDELAGLTADDSEMLRLRRKGKGKREYGEEVVVFSIDGAVLRRNGYHVFWASQICKCLGFNPSRDVDDEFMVLHSIPREAVTKA